VRARSLAIGAIVLVALPLALPGATAYTSAASTVNANHNPQTRFLLGDVVYLEVTVSVAAGETLSFAETAVLNWSNPATGYQATYGSVGPGTVVLLQGGTTGATKTVIIAWQSPANTEADANYKGIWTAQWEGLAQDPQSSFTLSWGSDFVMTGLRVANATPIVQGLGPFVADRTHKTVDGCLADVGNGASSNEQVTVALFYRTPFDPLLNDPTGTIVQTETAQIGWPGVACVDATPQNTGGRSVGPINAPGWYVYPFSWYAENNAPSDLASYYVGLRANPSRALWELDYNNNDIQMQATMQPVTYLLP
jgi:hypothetical protein